MKERAERDILVFRVPREVHGGARFEVEGF